MDSATRYRDRADAGRRLGAVLASRQLEHPAIIGIARGGVIVAAEVARILEAPIDVVVTRKLGAPQDPERAVGAIADDVVRIDERAIHDAGISRNAVIEVLARERRLANQRDALYRGGQPARVIEGKTVIVVDDGLATGWTARTTLELLRKGRPAQLVLAVPVGAASGLAFAEAAADEVICLASPRTFSSVSDWYDRFPAVSDRAVIAAIGRGNPAAAKGAA